MSLLILTPHSIRTELLPIPLELYLKTPIWAHQWLQLRKLFVFTAMPWGMFVVTVPTTGALIADNMPLDILSTDVFTTTAHSAGVLATSLTIAQIDSVPFVMTRGISLWTAHFPRTPALVLFSMTETQRDFDVTPVV